MSVIQSDPVLQLETACGSLLVELQRIWVEVGESDVEQDKMLLELEQECLEVYRRKVDQANRSRAQLRQIIADSEAELAAICSAMGERPVHIKKADKTCRSLKEELSIIVPQLEEMHRRKNERKKQFLDVVSDTQKLAHELHKSTVIISPDTIVDETDLSLRKLEELHKHLQTLEDEKRDRIKQILEQMHSLKSLCSVLGIDFKKAVSDVHPSLDDHDGEKNLSMNTIEMLMVATSRLRELKIERMQKLQDLAATMLELWNLMDTPTEEQQIFQKVTCNVAASEHEVTEPNALSLEFLTYVATEVSRLEELKSSKMKELVLKKKSELEEICRRTHMVLEEDYMIDGALDAIDMGTVDATCILGQIEVQIGKIKEEEFLRKEILEKVEKWVAACEEESWLEEYNRDENRYNAGRGAHLSLKRAEKARSLINKLPGIVEGLTLRVTTWEKDRGSDFMYDGVRLLSMLEDYTLLSQEKEHERRRQRDQKKLQEQLLAEQEVLFGSKPSPAKPQNGRRMSRVSSGGANNRRFSLAGALLQTPKHDSVHMGKPTPHSRVARNNRLYQNDQLHYNQDDDLPLYPSRKGLDIPHIFMKQNSFGSGAAGAEPRELDPPARTPFSPIPAASLSNSENQPQKNPPMSTPVKTPPPPHLPPNEDVTTPMAAATPLPFPTTLPTVSIPMQTALTPTAPLPLSTPDYSVSEETKMEYSFEERRFWSVCHKSGIYPTTPALPV